VVPSRSRERARQEGRAGRAKEAGVLTKRSWVLVGALLGLGACLLETKNVPGETGAPGAKGDPGPVGSVDAATLAALEAKISALETKVEALEKQSADPDCPVGYVRAANEPAGSPPPVHCQKGDPVFDEVVKVGSGGSAFWIDRYEATIWTKSDGPNNGGLQKFASNDDSSVSFPKNGQVLVSLFAVSLTDKIPASSTTA
jgi:hypothetical protein